MRAFITGGAVFIGSHLASAMVIRERMPQDFVFACFDERLARAAQSDGLETFPQAEATARHD
jgi:hypothetical protein